MSGSFFEELKRRNVFRVAVIYIVSSWLLMQIGDVMFPALLLPKWTITLLVAFLILGFPLALVFAWAYEITSAGLFRADEVPDGHSDTVATNQKINRLIIAVLAVAVAVLFLRNVSNEANDEQDPAIAATGQSIAVLPFRNQSIGTENAEFFAGGLHDELLTLLSKLGNIKVISRTSVERLDPELSVSEIGKLLGVATVLEGQVQRAGDRLRINVQLIDTAADGHIWANTYDRALSAENIFDVQSDIARTISLALQSEISASNEALLLDVPTHDMAALEHYLLGKQFWDESSYNALWSAAENLKKAVELDPDFAEAWAALSNTYNRLLQTGAIGLGEYLTVTEPAVNRALMLNPNLAEVNAELGLLSWHKGDNSKAEASFRKALSLNPDLPWSLSAYGNYLRETNRVGESIPVLEQALANDPLSPKILFELGKAEMFLGNIDKTIEYNKRSLEIDPDSVDGLAGLVQAYTSKGRFDLAMPWTIKLFEIDSDDFEIWAHMGLWLEMLGAPELSEIYMGRAYELGQLQPVVLRCQLQILRLRDDFSGATEVARRALSASVEDRWFSNRVFLRQIRDDALMSGQFEAAQDWYYRLYPELFDSAPVIDLDNVYPAADLAYLYQELGELEKAETLINSAFAWYAMTRPADVYNIETGIVMVDLSVLSGDPDGALKKLRTAFDSGWRYSWQWYLANPNLDVIRERPEFQAIVKALEIDMRKQREAYLALPNMGEFDLRD